MRATAPRNASSGARAASTSCWVAPPTESVCCCGSGLVVGGGFCWTVMSRCPEGYQQAARDVLRLGIRRRVARPRGLRTERSAQQHPHSGGDGDGERDDARGEPAESLASHGIDRVEETAQPIAKPARETAGARAALLES